MSITDFTTHVYPFNTLPLLMSHLHPKYAIFEAGRKLANLSTTCAQQLVRDYPSLGLAMTLHDAWTRRPPSSAERDSSYIDDDSDDGDGDGDGDSDEDYKDDQTSRGRPCRNKRDVPVSPTPTSKRRRQQTPPPHGSRANYLSEVAMAKHSQKLGKANLSDRIRKWTMTSQRRRVREDTV